MRTVNNTEVLYKLIRAGLWKGANEKFNDNHSDGVDWSEVYRLAEEQSVVGLVTSGIENFNAAINLNVPIAVKLQFVGVMLQIEQKNKELNYAAAQLHRLFKNGGMRSCVLKGQGVASLYPDPMRRQSGDIDIWVEGGRERILRFLKNSFLGMGRVVIHHVDARIIEGVDTEVHFVPSYSYNYLRYRKYKCFFEEQSDEQFNHYDERMGFAYPTNKFNAVYLMLHIFRHVFHEGIGLRQLVDYYFVLRQLTDEERKWAYDKLKWLGLAKMTGAVMWVQKSVFRLDDAYLLCAPVEKPGRFLLEEIQQGGNFGQFDKQYKQAHSKGGLGLYLANIKRLGKVFSLCPSEVLWAPFWKPGHWLWRKWKGYA